jgi:hypothetical protein
VLIGRFALQMSWLTVLVYRHWYRAFIVAIPATYGVALVTFARRVGTSDYDQFLVFHELQYWNANLFGLAKQWTPVMCSGLSLAGEPQVPFASLSMLLGYALGPLPGIVIGNVVFLTVGWVGAYLYSGLWFSDKTQRALAGSLFIGNGFFICRLAHGHLDFLPFLALPLALWTIHRAWGSILAAVLLGVLFTLVIDGSPVAIIHWLFWVGLYSGTLSLLRRSPLPLLTFVAACCVTCVLDAGYLWPMVRAQAQFPRLTNDTFTGPWSLLWFILIPMRGKVLPANGTGIELSVFIGPVLAYLIWRYRRGLVAQLPRELLLPLLVVSLVSVWLGMGSLRVAGLPLWMSPFDWLRPLPGFRSIGVTGRYWGFLALPLSLLAAAALWRYATQEVASRGHAMLIAAAFLIQMGFEGESLVAAWMPSRVSEEVALDGLFNGKLERVTATLNPSSDSDPHQQGEYISPVRAVVNCYDMDAFARADVRPGTDLIKSVSLDGGQRAPRLDAGFASWNRIRLETRSVVPTAYFAGGVPRGAMVRIVLNQAYHTGWSSRSCAVERGERDNLVARCPMEALENGPVDLFFFDSLSALGTRASLDSALLLGVVLGLMALVRLPRRRAVAAPEASG